MFNFLMFHFEFAICVVISSVYGSPMAKKHSTGKIPLDRWLCVCRFFRSNRMSKQEPSNLPTPSGICQAFSFPSTDSLNILPRKSSGRHISNLQYCYLVSYSVFKEKRWQIGRFLKQNKIIR